METVTVEDSIRGRQVLCFNKTIVRVYTNILFCTTEEYYVRGHYPLLLQAEESMEVSQAAMNNCNNVQQLFPHLS